MSGFSSCLSIILRKTMLGDVAALRIVGCTGSPLPLPDRSVLLLA